MPLINSEWSFLAGQFGKIGKDGEETDGTFSFNVLNGRYLHALLHDDYEPLLGLHE